MKRLITLLFLITLFSGVLKAQTTVTRVVQPNLDTLVTTITTSVSSVTHKYVPPVIVYKPSGPIVLHSNTNYSYLTIDCGNTSQIPLNGNGVSNIHIKKLRILNTTNFAVYLQNCHDITIDSVFFSNVGFGVYAYNCWANIKINNNQFLNINGISTNMMGHAIMFNNVNGGGCQMNYNRIENIDGVAIHPHDILNVYHSYGLPGDSIQVIGNWIRGGQLSFWPNPGDGACGIVLGDEYGGYQVARGNILVNPGAGGVANISNKGEGIGIKMDHNLVFSVKTPVSGQGMGVITRSLTDVGYNRVNWTNSSGGNTVNSTPYSQYWLSYSPIPLNWNTNKWADRTVTADMLPAVIITMK